MLKFSSTELHNNTDHIQSLAQREPVLLEYQGQRQVLIDYKQYLDRDKPFASLYEAFSVNLPSKLYQTLAKLEDEDLED